MTALVSVIIPTYHRPELVLRAVHSALAQTLCELEIIVVMDGPDLETKRVLDEIQDSRLKSVALEDHRGHPAVRNVGVTMASAHWVAFLDDDDEWMPQKLERQLEVGAKSRHRYPVVSCRYVVRNEFGDLIWPLRYPRNGEVFSEYMFCQSGIRTGEGVVVPSTLLAPTELVRQVPLSDGLKRHEDMDWQLRASRVDGFGLEFVPTSEPLAIWHVETNRTRISNSTDWRYSLNWALSNRDLFTSRSFVSFLMTTVSDTAARSGDWKEFFILIWIVFHGGRPSVIDLAAHLVVWLLPASTRQRMTVLWARFVELLKRTPNPAPSD